MLGKKSGCPSTLHDKAKEVQNTFLGITQKSARRASRELQLPSTTVWRILRLRLHMTPYRLQLIQQLKDTDKRAPHEFCIAMLEKLENDRFNERLFVCLMPPSTKVTKSISTTQTFGMVRVHMQLLRMCEILQR